MEKDNILVFLSRPNSFIEQHETFINNLQSYLAKFDIATITLQADNYDLTDSFKYLKGMIKQCYGIIVVGFKQIFIDKGKKKKNAVQNPNFFYSIETDVSGQALTSPFCHIEGTIGLLNDLPLLIMNEIGVREEGIIAGGRFSVKTNKFDLNNLDTFFADKNVERQINIWIGKVTDYYMFLNLKKV